MTLIAGHVVGAGRYRTGMGPLLIAALLLWGGSLPVTAAAAEPLHPLAEHGRVLVDPERRLDAHAALRALHDGGFRPLEPRETRFGYTLARLWIAFEPPPGLANLRRSMLFVDSAILDSVRLYHFRDGEIIDDREAGAGVPLRERPLPVRGAALPIIGFDPRTDVLLLSVSTRGTTAVRGWLTTDEGVRDFSARKQLRSAVFYGGMVVLLLLNGLLFSLTRVRSLLYLCLFIVAIIGHHALYRDTAAAVLPDLALARQHELYILFIFLSGVAALLFTRHALVLPKATPRLDLAIQVLATLTAAGAIAIPLLGVATSYRLAGTLALLANPVLIAAGVVRWRQGDRSARALVAAWSLLLIGIMLMALYRAGILPLAIVAEDHSYVLSAVASVLLSFAVFHRLLLLERDSDRPAGGRPSRMQGAAADGDRMIAELDQSVRHRNRELRAANERLEAVRRETERHAMTLNALFTSSVIIHRSDDPDEMLEHSLQQLSELYPTYGFGIVVHGDRPGDVRHRAFVHTSDEQERIIVNNAQLLGEGVRSTLRSLLLSASDGSVPVDATSRHGGWQFLEMGDRPRSRRSYLIIRGPDLSERSLDVLRVFCTQIATALENRRLSLELEDLANTDALTGIGNRKVFDAALGRAVSQATSRPKIPFCVLVVDINGLKQLNDSCGHEAGDALIRHVADILSYIIRREDSLVRTGGDEFVVICPGARPDTGPELAGRIQARLRAAPLVVETLVRGTVKVEVSVSIGTASSHDTEPQEVLARADARMYEMKQQHYETLGLDSSGRQATDVRAGEQ